MHRPNPDVYPIAAITYDALVDYIHLPAVSTLVENVLEYEHGTADVEDVNPGMTLELYSAVVIDCGLTLGNI